MPYQIVHKEASRLSDAINELVKQINELCNDGWKPQGGVSIAIERNEHEVYYSACQALLKKD